MALRQFKGKKSHKKNRKRKNKSRKKSRKRKKKAGFLFTGSLGYYLYQTRMNGKKAIFNLPVQYKDPEPTAQASPAASSPSAKGGKKSRKKRKRKRKKTRKKRGGADSLRDGIREIYKGKKASIFSRPTGPGSWGRQLNDLYAEYLKHLRILSSGQKVARKFKNLFRNAQTRKPLTAGEADIIFQAEAITMRALLKDMLVRKKSSIEEIDMNPEAQDWGKELIENDPEYERLSLLVLEERPRLSEEAEELAYSIHQLEQLISYIKRSPVNSSDEPTYIDV
jgi:hypothetical protein